MRWIDSVGLAAWMTASLGVVGNLACWGAPTAHAGGVVTVAMTAGDIPATTGNPDQGFEGFRFVGYNLYDGLLL